MCAVMRSPCAPLVVATFGAVTGSVTTCLHARAGTGAHAACVFPYDARTGSTHSVTSCARIRGACAPSELVCA